MPHTHDFRTLTKPTTNRSGPSTSSTSCTRRASSHDHRTLARIRCPSVASDVIDISDTEITELIDDEVVVISDDGVIDLTSEQEPRRKRHCSNYDIVSRLRGDLQDERRERRNAEKRLGRMIKTTNKKLEDARMEKKNAEKALEEATGERRKWEKRTEDAQVSQFSAIS